MTVRTCSKCGGTKPLSDYYAHPNGAGGHQNKCKVCCRFDAVVRYRDPKKKPNIVAYERERSQRQDRRAKAIEYQRKRRLANPEKTKARNAVSNALRDGRLVRRPCEVCGKKAQAHHLDYKHPLAVRWMCFKHHREMAHGQTVTAA